MGGLLDLGGLENIAESGDVSIPIPGGLSERAPGQPADVSIPTPASKEITAEKWKSTVAALHKSFKEAVDILGIISDADIVEESSDKNKEKEKKNMDMYGEYVSKFIESGQPGKPLTRQEFAEAVVDYMDGEEYTESKKEGSMLVGNDDKSGVGVRRARRTLPKDVQKAISKGYNAYADARKADGKKPEITEPSWMGAITQAFRNMYGTDDLSKAKISDLVNESTDFLNDFLADHFDE